MKALCELLVLIVWIIGIVLAKGFWSTLFAVVCPPWALYLVVERGMVYLGCVS
ncbi:hypothetical protein [uncultured Pseudacidovorax sp.]|uniref:hypothetical protein n=1 Tax=uncultured Pseudacidovorax sp. TaxID=679313 RepID=UPI0025D9908F|nr:hypothetical protein [uncultured Pseudacidovorax sp.]